MRRNWRRITAVPGVVWRIALVAGAVGCCLALPPRIGLHPALASALAVVVAGAAAALWPRGARWPRRPSLAPPRRGAGRWVRWSGVALLWAAIAWCVVSQVAPLTEPRSLVWSLRGLPLVLVAGVWVWPQLSQRWQRRALAAMVLPTGIALALVAWSSPPHPLDFQPYYVAVDGHGTLYVSDAGSPVIRVFAPDGTLRAKLRPGVASNQGIPGPGFMPPGPYNDPDGLGVPRATPGTGTVSATLRPYPFGADDFWFCGLAVGTHDRLYVPDWMRGRMLRFAPDGRLEARWPLPNGYHPSLGCVATAGNDVLLSDEHGTIVRLDATGRELARWTLPERSTGGISVAPDGTTLFALALTRVYRLNLASGATSSWALPAPSGPLGNPYQAILAASGNRLFITDLGQHRVDVYRTDGQSEGVWSGPGVWPGQFGQVGGLARDAAGLIYVADFDHRVVQRFTGSGEIDALYRSPDDDEFD